MKKNSSKSIYIAELCFAAAICFASAFIFSGCKKKAGKDFVPRLDTEKKVSLSTIGFFSNFEAFDRVTDDFNRFYPNVEFYYEQVSSDRFADYVRSNPRVDVLMSSMEVMHTQKAFVENSFADLLTSDVNLNAIDENLLKVYTINGKILSIPMGQIFYGMVVNETLLKKEGLSVPSNYSEFVNACEILKEKGYVPVQGPESKVYATLTYSMAMDLISENREIFESGSEDSAVEILLPAMEKIDFFIEKGYIDPKVNAKYPDENYDRSILNFFEGDVPFWVCDSEKVSGMKKRQSKSKKYRENPFEYTFVFAPLGEQGPYAYSEAWYGFTANRHGRNYDYALEFIRFLATKNEINVIANIKGIPSAAKEKDPQVIYDDIMSAKKVQMSCVNDGSINYGTFHGWYDCVNRYVSKVSPSEKEALKRFVRICTKKE